MDQLTSVSIPAPGSYGLFSSKKDTLLPPMFCTKADNAIIDDRGRLAVRLGYNFVTQLADNQTWPNNIIRTIAEDFTRNQTVVAVNGRVYNNIITLDDTDPLFIIGLTGVGDSGDFVVSYLDNFLIAVPTTRDAAAGSSSVYYRNLPDTGAALQVVPATSTDGANTPKGSVGIAAFGRVWAADSDKQTIKYSALLDPRLWHEDSGGGSIDMSSVWTSGFDEISAIAAFNGALVVFGRKHIVFWVDGQGSQLGLDPTQMYVSDVVSGVGCLSPHTIKSIGNSDMWFLSEYGVMSMQRLIAERSAPISTITAQVREEIMSDWYASSYDSSSVKAEYCPKFNFYLLSFPIVGHVWCISTKAAHNHESIGNFYSTTLWPISIWSMCSKRDGTLLIAPEGGEFVAQYGAAELDAGADIVFSYESPWLDFGEQFASREKLVKRASSIVYTRGNATFALKVARDFEQTFTEQNVVAMSGSVLEWDTPAAEWGEAEWGAGASLATVSAPLRLRGQYLKVAAEFSADTAFSLQQIDLLAKIGRMA